MFELMLVVQHGFDTVKYLQDTLHCHQVIDLSHIGYVFHNNGHVPETLTAIQEQVNDLSYKVLLPLFFTKELHVYRSELLTKLRRKIVKYREEQRRVLSGDVVRDSRRMRGVDSQVANAVRKVANTVCVSDLLQHEDRHRIQTYGDFPQFDKKDVCGMPSGAIKVLCPASVNYKVGHILNNFGNRVYRTGLDKSLRVKNDNIILAGGDVLATHALARQAVVYTNDPGWGTDIVGGVEQPIVGGYQCSRHRLLAYLGLFHLLCVESKEEEEMQDFVLQKSFSIDSELLKTQVMEFVERRVIERRDKGADIKASEISASASYTSRNAIDAAVITREMIHCLVADKGRLVPVVDGEENDGCYYNVLYSDRKYGNGKLVVNVTVPIAGLSTTQADYFQLYSRDGRALTSSIDLRTRSAKVLHLSDEGDMQSFKYYPVVITGDLSVG